MVIIVDYSKTHLKVLSIKGFIEVGAGTTELFLVECDLFQLLNLVIFWLFRKGFFC